MLRSVRPSVRLFHPLVRKRYIFGFLVYRKLIGNSMLEVEPAGQRGRAATGSGRKGIEMVADAASETFAGWMHNRYDPSTIHSFQRDYKSIFLLEILHVSDIPISVFVCSYTSFCVISFFVYFFRKYCLPGSSSQSKGSAFRYCILSTAIVSPIVMSYAVCAAADSARPIPKYMGFKPMFPHPIPKPHPSPTTIELTSTMRETLK